MRFLYSLFIFCLVLVLYKNSGAQTNFYDIFQKAKQKNAERKYDEGLKLNLQGLDAAEKTGNPTYMAYANMQVGNSRYHLQDRKGAIKWYMAGIAALTAEKEDSLTGKIYHNISAMYNELHEIDSTLKYSKRSIAILKAKKKYTELSRALLALTDIYILQKDYVKADQQIREGQKYARLSGDQEVLAYSYTKRAGWFGVKKQYKKAIEQLYLAGPIYRKLNSASDLSHYYRMQSINHFKIGDEKALSFTDSVLILRTALFKTEIAKSAAEYQTVYETEKKERENKLLQQENLLQQARIGSRNKTILGLIIGIVLIAALVLWRVSVASLRKKESELEAAKTIQKEKERISRDLHDNVGGQLSYVLYSLEGLNETDSVKRSSLVTTINESVRNVIGNLRETIWAISDESVSANDLSDKLKVYVRQMFRNRQTKISFNEKIEHNITLSSSTGLNVYRICQEIVNNAFKHAQASELTVTLHADGRLEIVISDNGVGFDKEQINKEGYGMSNIRKRAEEAGIQMELYSEPGKGTRYRLLV